MNIEISESKATSVKGVLGSGLDSDSIFALGSGAVARLLLGDDDDVDPDESFMGSEAGVLLGSEALALTSEALVSSLGSESLVLLGSEADLDLFFFFLFLFGFVLAAVSSLSATPESKPILAAVF